MRAEIVALSAVLFASGCSGPYSNPSVAAKETASAAAVRVETLRLERIPELITATGELYAEDLATVSAKVPGRVATLKVDLGSRVEQGQVLATLEQEDYLFRVKQAEALVEQSRARLGLAQGDRDEVDPAATATVRQAAATLEEARLNFGRISELVKQGILARSDFDRAQASLKLAEAQHQAAVDEIYQARALLIERRAELALARQQLEDTVIRAPFQGAITRRQTSPGEYLGTNAPLLTLVRAHPIRLRLEVPERLAAKVTLGQRVDVQLENAPAHTGRVVRLSPAIEAQNRTLLVEAEIPNEDGSLRPGSFAQGAITVNPNARGLSVDPRSVVTFAGVDRVFVASDGVLAERIIRTGRKLPAGRVEIVSGLRPGEMVVAEASERLTNGQAVRITGN